jgi:protein ImuA
MMEPTALSNLLGAPSQARSRAAVMHELRRLLPAYEGSCREGLHKILPFDLAAVDSHLEGGLARGAFHEVVPEMQAALPAAFGFIAAFLARISSPFPLVFVLPVYTERRHGRLSGHGLNALGLDPTRLIVIETAHRKDTLWAIAEALRSTAPAAVAGMIDTLDLKTSQKLQLAAGDAGLPLLLLRPAPTLEASAAATRWRIGTAEAARDRFGLYARPRWHLHLERARNGRPGEWVMEYDHVAHRFSLAATLADPAFSRGASDGAAGQRVLQAGRS